MLLVDYSLTTPAARPPTKLIACSGCAHSRMRTCSQVAWCGPASMSTWRTRMASPCSLVASSAAGPPSVARCLGARHWAISQTSSLRGHHCPPRRQQVGQATICTTWQQHASARGAFTCAAGKSQHVTRRALGDITNTPAAVRPTQQPLKRPPSLQKPANAASAALPRPSQLFTQQEKELPAASAVQHGAVHQAAPQVDADLQRLAEQYAGVPAMILALLNTLSGPACGVQKEPLADIAA